MPRLSFEHGYDMSYTYPKNIHFKCDRCTLCCGDTENRKRSILLLETEAQRISKKTSMKIDDFAEATRGFKPYNYKIRKRTKDRKCVFLKENLCSIYSLRPLICMFYPFQLENAGHERYMFLYTNECPGIGKGEELKKAFFQNLFQTFLGRTKTT